MKTLLPLAALVAVPAAAQVDPNAEVYHASDTWPVHVTGAACTVTQARSETGGILSVSYDGSLVTLTSTNALETPLPSSGKADLAIVFLDNGSTRYDDGWGSREFTYRQQDGVYHFSTRFAGETNVRQILSDLAASRTVGLLQGRQVVVDYDLDGLAAALRRLDECAARRVAGD